jgi:hypothetical protein
MLYVYVVLIVLGVNAATLAGFALLMRWALPRYGARAMRMVMRPPPPIVTNPRPFIKPSYPPDKP